MVSKTITTPKTGCFFTPDCPFKNKCSSRGYKCSSCKHNGKNKDDYYEPNNGDYWFPYKWDGPYTPFPRFRDNPVWCMI